MPKACGCGEEGTRLSQPQCPMAWENSPELEEQPWVGKWSVGGPAQTHGRDATAFSSVPGGPTLNPNCPFPRMVPWGCCLADATH